MSGSDPKTLEQYRNDANLTARINLHRRFSTSPISWNRWVFDQMRIPACVHVLELGAGTGLLWKENRDRLPVGLDLVVSDSSGGMLRAAREQLDGLDRVQFRQIDAAHIPDQDRTFDVVIANHMLYHVPDRVAVFSEVVRVLRSNGHFYATTNGDAHMRELDSLVGPEAAAVQLSATRFGLENGGEQLAAFFGSVEVVRQNNPLSVTDASAVTAYVRSLSLDLPESDLDRIGDIVQRSIASRGAFHITRDSGMFICGDPRR